MKLLLFAGAGTSIELGVPGMSGLAREFLDHVSQWDVEPDLVEQIMGESLDVEHLIETLDQICTARPSLEAIGQDVVALDRVDKVRAEVEWFVQHAAERVVANQARLLWGPLLRTSAATELVLVTTNYDRAIELAANAEKTPLQDGFGAFGDGETAAWTGFEAGVDSVRLVKLHGSTDWYAVGETSRPTKLRHPMPLFGRAVLRTRAGQELGSALVLPSREKLLTRDPYPRLSQAFLNSIDECDVAIFVGSSMRDLHVRSAAETAATRVPVFVVDPLGDVHEMEGGFSITQTASRFLMSSLPNALLSPNPVQELEGISRSADPAVGILEAVGKAREPTVPSDLRCKALETLDEIGAPLDPFSLRRLLQDEDSRVARYSLGIIPLSPERDSLMKEAADSPHAAEPAFQEDLKLLEELLEDEMSSA